MLELAADVRPPQWTWNPTFENRERYERRINSDFLSSRPDNKTEWFARFRPGLVANGPGKARITIVYQFGYSESTTTSRPTGLPTQHRTTVRSNSDLFQGNVEWGSGPWRITAGRYLFVLGDGRIVAGLQSWGNLGRTFDGLRAKGRGWDLFLFKPGVNTGYNPEQTALGISKSTSIGQSTFLGYQNDRTARLTRFGTLDHLWKAKFGCVSTTAEGAFQFGHTNGVSTEAWLAYAKARVPVNAKVDVALELTAASGGQSASKVRTFLPPYPTGAFPYGVDVLTGNRNINKLGVVAIYRPAPGLRVSGEWNTLSLRDAKDGWYGLGNTINPGPNGAYRDPSGAAGRDVGRFWQIEANYEPNPHLRFLVGFGVMTPGKFIRSLNGGVANDQTWAAAQFTYKF